MQGGAKFLVNENHSFSLNTLYSSSTGQLSLWYSFLGTYASPFHPESGISKLGRNNHQTFRLARHLATKASQIRADGLILDTSIPCGSYQVLVQRRSAQSVTYDRAKHILFNH